MTMPVVKIAPNNPLFDLPVLVGIQRGTFKKVGLDVQLSGATRIARRRCARARCCRA